MTIRNMLSIGMNRKLGQKGEKQGIAAFNLPRLETCLQSTELCRRDCYDRYRARFPKVAAFRQANFESSKQPDFVDRMIDEIQRRDVKYVRIHSSGDFYNDTYYYNWHYVIAYLQSVKFLAFSKSIDVIDKCHTNLLNFNLYLSVFPDSNHKRVNEVSQRLGLPKAYTVYPFQRISNFSGFMCQGLCYKCMNCFNDNGDNVIFPKH